MKPPARTLPERTERGVGLICILSSYSGTLDHVNRAVAHSAYGFGNGKGFGKPVGS